ncbi:response regulator [Flagellimonas onchidii]|uniref:response regulator n=1 Tax=Flagellimonas onchidii TaxID=2562684 RepID=UPI00145618BA|nr:response regulator [Allomuricauda onchidii]
MREKVKILMIDDHPSILEGYQLLIEKSGLDYDIHFWKAKSCDQAWEILKTNERPFHIVLLDICMPPSSKYSFINGEELGIKIRERYTSKIIVLTSLSDEKRISNILHNVKPDGLIIKTDVTKHTLSKSISAVLSGNSYLSEKMLKVQSNLTNSGKDCLDVYDIKILSLLSKGEKTKNLPNYLPFSLSSIERRKKKIKLYFGLETNSNYELLDRAKSHGFI